MFITAILLFIASSGNSYAAEPVAGCSYSSYKQAVQLETEQKIKRGLIAKLGETQAEIAIAHAEAANPGKAMGAVLMGNQLNTKLSEGMASLESYHVYLGNQYKGSFDLLCVCRVLTVNASDASKAMDVLATRCDLNNGELHSVSDGKNFLNDMHFGLVQ